MPTPANFKKADLVMETVSGWIKSGKLAVGDKLPSERELAKTLGMNLLTVNKAMARLADSGLINRAHGRGGSHVARLPQKDSIAIVCDMLHLLKKERRHIDQAIEAFMTLAAERGYSPHFLPGRGSNADEFLESLSFGSSVWKEIKGVVSMAWYKGMDERLAACGTPMVTIGTEEQGTHLISHDYEELGRIAARESMKAGARRIVVVHNKSFMFGDFNNPVKSFEAELEACGWKAKVSHVPTDELSAEAGELWARQLMPELRASDALFITNDNVAEGFGRVLASSSAPKTALVQASVGLIPDMPPRFKRISFDSQELAHEALTMLEKLMRGEIPLQAKLRADVKPRLETKTAGRLTALAEAGKGAE